MTKKEIARASYTNISKRARKEQTKANRGETFVGCRSTYFADKTKYNRKRLEKIEY
nr:hypothetical protein [uncultured Treponema sp.]